MDQQRMKKARLKNPAPVILTAFVLKQVEVDQEVKEHEGSNS